jgi:hypothetical protein
MKRTCPGSPQEHSPLGKCCCQSRGQLPLREASVAQGSYCSRQPSVEARAIIFKSHSDTIQVALPGMLSRAMHAGEFRYVSRTVTVTNGQSREW